MRIGRRLVVFAVAAAVALALGGTALAGAISNSSSIKGSRFSPSKLPKQEFRKGKLFVHTHTNYANPGNRAQGGFVHRARLFFDDDFKIRTKAIPTCAGNFASGTTLASAMAACKPAKIGKGTASTAPTSNFPGCVLAFNGHKRGHKPTVVLFARVTLMANGTANCRHPAHNTSGDTSVTLVGVLKRARGDFGRVLDVNGVDTAPLPLDDFTTTVKRGKYVRARCHDGNRRLNIKAKFTYSGSGQPSDSVSSRQKCEVKHTHRR
jgi:hypothetical protein